MSYLDTIPSEIYLHHILLLLGPKDLESLKNSFIPILSDILNRESTYKNMSYLRFPLIDHQFL